jgi:hypothetical protein
MTTQTAAVTQATPFQVAETHYRSIKPRFNALRGLSNEQFAVEERAFLAAVEAVDLAPASSLEEFARSFIIAMDDGESLPIERTLDRLLADARRLVASRFETLRVEYAELNTNRNLSEEGCARSSAIERIMANEPCQSVADARAKLRFIVDADQCGVRLDGEEAAQIATDAALYLAPEA